MLNTIPQRKYLVITFSTTSNAYMMEKSRRDDNISGRLIPLPASISAGCGAAFATENFNKLYWQEYMKNKNIKFDNFYEVEL